MSMNITHTMNTFNFESRENLHNTAKDILNRQGASTNALQKIFDQTVFNSKQDVAVNSLNPQLAIIKASSQITMNNTMKETLKYLKAQAVKRAKKEPVLGELWNLVSEKDNDYSGELVDFVIDSTSENIFAAA